MKPRIKWSPAVGQWYISNADKILKMFANLMYDSKVDDGKKVTMQVTQAVVFCRTHNRPVKRQDRFQSVMGSPSPIRPTTPSGVPQNAYERLAEDRKDVQYASCRPVAVIGGPVPAEMVEVFRDEMKRQSGWMRIDNYAQSPLRCPWPVDKKDHHG